MLARRLFAEALGTALLLATVVGSGIMGVALAEGNDAIALLANAFATAAVLYVLIVILGPISGAHFNPAVTVSMMLRRDIALRDGSLYIVAQVIAAILGVVLAHAMFEQSLIQPGVRVRTGTAQWLSEAVATFGLVMSILLGLRHRPAAVPGLVAGWIFAAYWFTASTSFANPAVTLARAFTQSFAGIRLDDVAVFVIAQLVGAVAATAVSAWLLRSSPNAPGAPDPTEARAPTGTSG